MPTKIWRFCPRCYKLADPVAVIKVCPYRACAGTRLEVLPLDPDAAQAALRVGGSRALEQMIVGLIAGEDAGVVYEPEEYRCPWTSKWGEQCSLAAEHTGPCHIR